MGLNIPDPTDDDLPPAPEPTPDADVDDYSKLSLSEDELPALKPGDSYKGLPHPDKLYLTPEARMHMKNMQAQMTKASQEAARAKAEMETIRAQLSSIPNEIREYIKLLEGELKNADGTEKKPDLDSDAGFIEAARLESIKAQLHVEKLKDQHHTKKAQEKEHAERLQSYKDFANSHSEFDDLEFRNAVLDTMESKGLMEMEDAYLLVKARLPAQPEEDTFTQQVRASNKTISRREAAALTGGGSRVSTKPDLSDAGDAWEIAQRLYPQLR